MKGSIIKREGKKGVSWLLKYDLPRDPITNERRIETKTVRGTRKDAERELRKVLSSLDGGTFVAREKLKLSQWIETWLTDHAAHRVSQRTLEGYRVKLEANVIPTLGAIEIQKLTAPDIQRLYSELRESGRRVRGKEGAASSQPPGLSAQTVLHVHRILFQCLKAATRQRVIARNPAEDVTPPSPKRARAKGGAADAGGQIRALDRSELPALFAACAGTPSHTIAALAVGTGMRRGEMLALRWSDVDLDKKTIRINRAMDVTRKFGVQIKDAPKNDSSRRTIGIDDGLCSLLRAHRKEQKELALKLGKSYPADCLIFPALIKRARGRQPLRPDYSEVDFNRPHDPGSVTKDFRALAAAAGFPDLRLHDLRHTHATHLLLEGVPVHAVAQRLGHSTPVVTMTIYAHVLRRAEDQAAQVSGDLLKAALGQ